MSSEMSAARMMSILSGCGRVACGGELDDPAHAPGPASGQVDRTLTPPCGGEPGHLEGLRARQALAELARHDVPDDAVPERCGIGRERRGRDRRTEEHTSELQSPMRTP